MARSIRGLRPHSELSLGPVFTIDEDRVMLFDQPLKEPMLQRYRDYARQRQMTLGDLLLENRIIFLEGVINDAVANLTVMKFLFLQYENRTQGISFYIN